MDDIAITIDHVGKTFKLPHEKSTSVKGALINKFRGGNRGYERQEALKDVSFEVERGEFFGIAGRNGSGKSTLLKLLAGIYVPTSGGIQVNGKLTPFIELGVGFNPELTGRENVYLNGALLGFNRKEMTAMYKDIVDFAELEKFMDQKLKNYSSGMQVRLAFSIAIRAQGDILLLDEVLAVGDAAFQQKCYDYFEELKSQQKTVVFVSHDMAAIRRFCTRCVYVEEGQLKLIGTPEDIADRYLEENIAQPAETGDSTYKVHASLKPAEKKGYELSLKYETHDKDTYIGVSVFWQGVSVAEITTPPGAPLQRNGTVSLMIPTQQFNPGVYLVGASLFSAKNRELLATATRQSFTIKGQDATKGGALKLESNWVYPNP